MRNFYGDSYPMKSAALAPVSNRVLNSWKEVACYLERGVRTVQRWEAELGLPVRRPRGRKRSAVIAICSEIDEWVNACPAFVASQDGNLSSPIGKIRLRGQLADKPPLNEAILRSRFLRGNVRRSRQELARTIDQLLSSLKIAARMNEDAASESSSLPPTVSPRAKDGLLNTAAPATGRVAS